jgi:hypothetical protein
MAIQQVRAQVNGVWHVLSYNSSNGSGNFSKSITLANGNNTIIVISEDTAGRETTVTITGVLDTSVPVISSVTIVPNPVDAGATMVISVEVTG